ncbi:hypothetical protein ACLOJK_030320 [Asimina triloba]
MEVEKGPRHETQGYGGSLPVRNVQDMASTIPSEIIPERYIRPDMKLDPISSDPQLQIPTIDLAKLLDQTFSGSEMDKLHLACQDWGFFQLLNHGVDEEVIEKMKSEMIDFFKLPLEEKMAYSQIPNSLEGYGHSFVVSEDQKLDWGDMFYLVAQPIHIRTMKLWPTHSPTFRDTMDKYSLELQSLTILLVGTMAQNLGIPAKNLTDMFEEGTQGLRTNYYPPCPQTDKVLGLSPHSDGSSLTLLLQVNEVPGLQVRKDGKWVPAKPIPGSFIVNIGDILTNGAYKSIEHRAVINPVRERLSIAAFHSTALSKTIGPLPDFVKDGEAYYRSVSREEYACLTISKKLDGKNRLELLKLKK